MDNDKKSNFAELAAVFHFSSFWDSDVYNLFTCLWEEVGESYVI